KMAGSLDGRSALANGQSQWITGPEARADGHRFRARAQAILTGVGTLLEDDPLMTVRGVDAPMAQVTATPVPLAPSLRVVLDSHLRMPVTAKILQGGCLVATASTDAERTAALRAAGAEVLVVPDSAGRVHLKALLRNLAERGINEVHLEAGPRLSGVFLKAGLIDELLLYMAPTLLGSDARGWFDDLNLTNLDQKTQWRFQDVRMLGADLRIVARPVQ
ncbi:MAG: RibD family protein, partial [Fluviibacter sp.]